MWHAYFMESLTISLLSTCKQQSNGIEKASTFFPPKLKLTRGDESFHSSRNANIPFAAASPASGSIAGNSQIGSTIGCQRQHHRLPI
jgi:hypothetical protein